MGGILEVDICAFQFCCEFPECKRLIEVRHVQSIRNLGGQEDILVPRIVRVTEYVFISEREP